MKRALAPATTLHGAAALGAGGEVVQRPGEAAAPKASLDAGDILARVSIVVGFTFLASRLGTQFLETGRLTGLLLLTSEALVILLTMFRRATGVVDRSVRARVVTSISLVGPLLVIPASSAPLIPELATVTISAIGLFIVIAGKLSLGRSFGLMPANRGVVSSGLYRIVRHPIYMGYLIGHVGFLAANAVPWNVLTFLTADIALLIRAVCEERVLSRDAAYREYSSRVQHRVVPGLF